MNKESDSKTILLTGGAGYIGSHCVIALIEAGYEPIVLDNYSNSSAESIRRVEEITGRTISLYEVDILDLDSLRKVFKEVKNSIYGVIHLAGLKAVGESVSDPVSYYKVNVGGSANLLQVMAEFGVHRIVFSSSATVYGSPSYLPLDETHPVGSCTNPYGKTKYFIEEIIKDLCASNKNWSAALLRYFNPTGSHPSGRIGEDPKGPPNNLMPYISQVAIGKRDKLSVFGSDFDTPDGTGVRDYIHVMDLAEGHIASLKTLDDSGCKVYNLGTGVGYSVLDMVKAFEGASGKKVPYEIVGRRSGDVASCYSDPKLAFTELGWKTKRTLQDMCADLWRWQSSYPNGFQTE